MGPDPTNDEPARKGESDAEWVEEEGGAIGARKRFRGVWSAEYLRTFTTLLSEHTVLLKAVQQGYTRDDPVHEQRSRALQHLRQQLRMDSDEEVKQRIKSFKKFAGNRLRQVAERAGAGAAPEAILRAAPRWLRELEPHLNLWTFRKSRKKRSQTGAKTQQGGAAAPLAARTPQTGGGAGKQQGGGEAGKQQGWCGARLAQELVRSARALRSLDAGAVCRRVRVPADKLSELQCAWWRMLDVVRRKLALQRDGGEGGGAGARFSPVEAQLADLLLLLEDTLSTLGESGDYDTMQGLVGLFHLAQVHRLEEPPGEGQGEEAGRREMAARWKHAHRSYQAQTISFRGTCRSLVLLQRRWHELKGSARRSVQAYSRAAATPSESPEPREPPSAPSPLHAAIVKRFPHVVTAPLPSWRALVNAGAVHEDSDQSEDESSEPEPEPDQEAQLEGLRLLSAWDLAHYRHERTAKDEEDDLVLIEKEIETIDLINMDEGRASPSPPAQHCAFHDHVKQQLRNERKKFANQLQEELHQQLKDIQLHEGVSEMTLLQESRPEGAPLFIYDSDSDVDSTEDRNRNIELIAATLGDEDLSGGSRLKLEGGLHSPPSSPDPDECNTIDEKLLMDARVVLVRMEEGGVGWPPGASRPRKRSLSADPRSELSVKVKIENIDEEICDEPKGRQVKTIAKKLISEMMREESADLTTANINNNKKKKVQLPNIDEVRKNNLNMLTAQVAPLSTDGAGGVPPLKGEEGQHTEEGDTRRSSTESSGSLRIDETGGASDDVTLTADQLRRALARLEAQRCAEDAGRRASGPQHCCTARRQRAVNAARRRMAARSGRAPPAPLDIHGASACARSGRCACCCRHLLAEPATGAQLQREADDVEAALKRMLQSGSPHQAQESGDNENSNNKNRSNKNKKMSQPQAPAQVVRETESPAVDPLQEWFRQKTLNRQYFNLNLKTKPQSQPQPQPQPQPQSQSQPQPQSLPQPQPQSQTLNRQYFNRNLKTKPQSQTQPQSQSQSQPQPQSLPQPQLQEPNAPQPAHESFISIPKIVYGNAYAATSQRVPPKTTSTSPSSSIAKIVLGNKMKPPNVTVVPISNTHFNSTKTINRSVNMITAPSKQLPRGTIVKLSSAPPTAQPAALLISTNQQGKIVISNPNQIKIVPAASLQTKIPSSASNLGKIMISTANQRKIDDSMTNRRKRAASTANLGKIVFADQIKLSSVVPKLAKQNSPIKLKVLAQKGSLSAVRAAAGIRSPVRIAPKPSPDQDKQAPPRQANQAMPAQGDEETPNQGDRAMPAQDDEATPGQADQAMPAQGDEATPGQSDQAMPAQVDEKTPGQGDQAEQGDEATPGQGSAAEEQQSGELRGTDMKVIKISSSSGAISGGGREGLPVVSSPRSLLRPAPSATSPPPDAAPVNVNPNVQFKRKDLVMPLERFLAGADPTRLVVQCVDAEAGVLAPLQGHYVLSEREPRRAYCRPTYWSLGTDAITARVMFEDVKGGSSRGAASALLDAPDKMCLDSKVYVKIKDEPLIYARVLFALRSAEECHEELVRDTALHFAQAGTGMMCSLSRDAARGPDVFALLSPNLHAAKALAAMLNQLQLPVSRGRRGAGRGAAAARADANARADMVMMMNNVNRKPIEMVYVDSDDEGAALASASSTDFKGLEHFEELEDFEL